jgi:hypothetical protein
LFRDRGLSALKVIAASACRPTNGLNEGLASNACSTTDETVGGTSYGGF